MRPAHSPKTDTEHAQRPCVDPAGFGHRRALATAASVLLVLIAGCSTTSQVTRKNGELLWQGRSISPAAYAWYARGLRLEATGQLHSAEKAFAEATLADPASGSAWAAWGRVVCARSFEEANGIFLRGQERAEEQLPVWTARSACSQRHGRLRTALEYAQRAVRVAPRSREASARWVAIANAFQDTTQASVIRAAYENTFEESLDSPPARPVEADVSLAELDAIIAHGDLSRVRAAAVGLISPGELSLRLLAHRKWAFAEEQAALVLGAEADQPDATLASWLVAEYAATATFGPHRLDMKSLQRSLDVDGLSTLGVLLFAEHLRRTTGDEAAASFSRTAFSGRPVRTQGDVLVNALADRLKVAEPTFSASNIPLTGGAL